jgi:hypothetical protein
MTSIAFIALFISLVCILPAWLIADSVALRFLVMFIGLFSAVYAIQDVYDDGVAVFDNGVVQPHEVGSDANAYACLMIEPPEVDARDTEDISADKARAYEKKVWRRTKRQ